MSCPPPVSPRPDGMLGNRVKEEEPRPASPSPALRGGDSITKGQKKDQIKRTEVLGFCCFAVRQSGANHSPRTWRVPRGERGEGGEVAGQP